MINILSEFGENPTLDNAELTSEDVAWLAGVIDGEGSIVMNKKNNRLPTFCICVANSCPILLDKAQRIFYKITGDLYKISEKKVYKNSLIKPTKPCFQIGLRKAEAIYKILSLINKHLTTKRNRAQLLLDFLSIRVPERMTSYLMSDLSKKKLDDLKHLWGGVETKRETPEMDEAIVRS